MFEKILVVCVGNICRSPMAEALMRHAIAERGRQIDVRSAGLGALVGHPADENVQLLMERRGIDVSEHRAVQLHREMLSWADLVLVMEEGHRAELRASQPIAAGKVMLLGHWVQSEIPDPYRQDLSVFEDTMALVDRAVDSWVEKL